MAAELMTGQSLAGAFEATLNGRSASSPAISGYPDARRKARKVVTAEPLAESPRLRFHILDGAFAVNSVNELSTLKEVMSSARPDILVIDLTLPRLRRGRGLRAIHQLSPTTKIIALTDALAEDEGLLVLKSGAKGYCSRAIEPAHLARAVTAVLNGEIWASRKLVRALVAELVSLPESGKKARLRPIPDPRLERLTERQRAVAVLISRGASNKEVSNRLNISERTVKAHLTAAFRNVGVSDRLQLALLLRGRSS